MSSWPWWMSGAALAGLAVSHWLSTGQTLSVSGRYTHVVNRLRFGPEPETPVMSEAELMEAMRAATVAEFGAAAIDPTPALPEPEPATPPTPPAPPSLAGHGLFLGGLALGGAASAALGSGLHPTSLLRGAEFSRIFGQSYLGPAALLVGGVLVGFGTRMAGGCTSGHGLCGVSRGQPGSLLATMAFFGTGILVSLLVRVLS